MVRFRDVLVVCWIAVHVTSGYVDLPAEMPPPMFPVPSECRDLMDLYLVIDGSDSIDYFDFDTLKNAIASLVPQMRLGKRQARVGMLVYSSGIPRDSEHPFSADFDHLIRSAQSLSHPRDGTNTALGIEHMRHMFQRYGRPKVPWVAVVITDGISKDLKATAFEANLAREMGISMFAVGITKKINHTELSAIADTEKQVIQLDFFAQLQTKLAAMMKRICPCAAPPVVPLAECSNGPRAIGSIRTYKCKAGYHQRGKADIVCRDDSTWSPLDPYFECAPCGATPKIQHAICDGTDNLIGAKRTYRCDERYALIGNPQIECQTGATWSVPKFTCSPCGNPPNINLATCKGGGNFVGDRRAYECDPRYALIGDSFIQCQSDGQWSIPQFTCEPCGDTPPVVNGLCVGGDHFVNTVRKYECEKGYAMIGDPYITCLPNGQWSPAKLSCSLCGDPQPLKHGTCGGGDFFVDSVREYQCDTGYARIGDPFIRCQRNGQWSEVQVRCSLCGNTPPLQHGTCGGGDNIVGSLREYQCDLKYARIGDPFIRCQDNGQWSDLLVQCKPCGPTPPIAHGKCGGGDHFVSTVRKYECEKGYALIGDPYITCLETGEWSPAQLSCSLCGDTPPLQHGTCGGGDNFVDSVREYQCDGKYARIGDPFIRCQNNGQWSDLLVQCKPCGPTPPIAHGTCGGGDHFVNTVRKYECEKGFALIGDPYITCLPTGHWSPAQASCSLCGDTPPLQHGSCGGGDSFVDSVREYYCDLKYARIGDPFIRCQDNGQWSDLLVQCKPCGPTPPIAHGKCGGGDHFVNTVRKYECEKGYALIGDPYITCLETGEWSPAELSCSLCGDTPPLQHGTCGGGDNFVDSVREYQCDGKYARIGDPFIRCQNNGQWSDLLVQCKPCGPTPPIAHGTCGGGDHFVNTVRKYECEKGFALIGDPYITCLPTGHWSPAQASCSLCGDTPPLQHGSCGGGDSFVDSVREYYCDLKYARIGDPFIRCQDNGQWSDLLVQCKPCGPTPPIAHGKCGGGDHFVNTVRKYECEKGYALIGDPYITCLETGEWSPAELSCSLCGDTPPLQHGTCGGGDNFVDSVREYQCDGKYARIGDPFIRCQNNGQWSDLLVQCKPCGPTPPIAHGTCGGGDHFVNTVRKYECEKGFALIGDPYITCLPTGHWSPAQASCSLCGDTPPLQHGSCGGGDSFVDSVREYYCDLKYARIGDPFIRCQDNGQWSDLLVQCKPCGPTPPIAHGKCGGGDHFVNTVRKYECEKGYALIGDPYITCLETGEWSPAELSCSLCGDTPPLQHGTCGGGDNFVDSVREYQCDGKYARIGDPFIRCQNNGQWSDLLVQCKPCGPTPPIAHGTCGGGDHFVNTVRKYECEKGFALIGDPYITCLPTGQWSSAKLSCSLCGDTPPLQHGTCGTGDYFVDSVREYQCDSKYARIGDPFIRCQNNGQWSDLLVQCKPCGPTPPIDHGRCSGGDHFVNTVRKYECEKGYALIGDPYITCLSTGEWSPAQLSCSLCGNTPPINHGSCLGGDHFVNSVRQYICDPGYELVGDPYIQCQSNGQWSKAQLSCHLSCGDTPPVDHGICTGVDHVVDSVREYKCDAGYAMVGDPFIRCQSNGKWSDVLVTCSLCGEPPKIPNADCGPGDYFVGNRRTYKCHDGFTDTGSRDIECLPNGKWSPIDLRCDVLECGALPQVSNAYPKLGPSRAGMHREYYCDIGYRMRGLGRVKCLSSGQWESPKFSCYEVTTPKPSTPAPVPAKPSVCDTCRMKNGVGYALHPYDCNQYIVCYFGKGIEAVYRRCPFGLFWDQSNLTCNYPYAVDCPNDRCATKSIHGYKPEADPNNCCSYWKCENGVSKGACCGKGKSFNPSTGTCENDHTCQSPCLFKEELPGCGKRPNRDKAKYEEHVGQGRWIVRHCAPGSGFNPVDCKCSLHLMKVPGKARQVCKPTVYLPFHMDHSDMSSERVYVHAENVSIVDGAAYFNGNSRLMIPRFTNQKFRGDLVIKFRYREIIDHYAWEELQALVTNGDCGSDPSIIISKIPSHVIMATKTRRLRTLAVATMNTIWKEVVFMHNEVHLEGRVCGASSYTSSSGPIQSTHCALQIGYGQGLHKFKGYIDDFTIYQCRPTNLDDSSY